MEIKEETQTKFLKEFHSKCGRILRVSFGHISSPMYLKKKLICDEQC